MNKQNLVIKLIRLFGWVASVFAMCLMSKFPIGTFVGILILIATYRMIRRTIEIEEKESENVRS